MSHQNTFSNQKQKIPPKDINNHTLNFFLLNNFFTNSLVATYEMKIIVVFTFSRKMGGLSAGFSRRRLTVEVSNQKVLKIKNNNNTSRTILII